MRIINGRDYYDNAMAFGRDEIILFVREKDRWLDDSSGITRGLHFVKPYFSFRSTCRKTDVVYRGGNFYTLNGTYHEFAPLTVIFCGKVYHGICMKSSGVSLYFWQKEQFDEWCAKVGIEWVRNSYRFDADLKSFFVPYDAYSSLLGWLIDNHVVTAIRFDTTRPEKWSINSDRLKEVQFYRTVDAFTAFQEISMWIGGVIPGAGRPMVTIPDIVRIEKHGFDKKTSFRKPPE